MKPLVYLAGGIAGLTGAESRGWRWASRNTFKAYGIAVRNPMREKFELKADVVISNDCNAYSTLGPYYTTRAIMTRDFNDVKQSDALLVNLLGAKNPSLGTVMELAWAYALQKPTVVIMEPTGNPHDNHPMIHEAIGIRVTTLDDGIRAVAVILGEGS